ncbi:splicing factor 3B subunit 3 [Capsaspora owczarzaki ATCC 30864]|uniref:splicing factor 3B subunit 3 n=1 Tax=Capsaspora owczarzaki (strain ATCC 30864) TaxID=595528 RepID=UPI0001FE2756|nr:splicing factor 3B subunit 3 [Capsaspora owczarzaki ATCC 30864]|eukprot:XP_004345726.1 splicing factor 3B subunit 3 [Capsaspora owczarzaki ATCC 30864]
MAMHLYSLTLQRASAITCAVHGNFSGTKQQEIAVGRGSVLELLALDQASAKVKTIASINIFGVVRCLTAFRLTGASKDYLVVGSDSGRVAILEYNPTKYEFERVHLETYGKSGSRRIVPGQYLAADAKGRAIMISAVEKQKLVYVMNRDSTARLTITSPLDAHKAHAVVFATVGLDVGFEAPTFACVELDYEEADNDPSGEAVEATQQHLVFYELDLGLNHVVRKSSEPLPGWANMLIQVPGADDGPGGVVVCCEGFLVYKSPEDPAIDVRCPFPGRRHDISDPSKRGAGRGIVVAHASHKTKTKFFFVVQLDNGDMFKVTLDVADDNVVSIRMKLFDTLPVATSLHILRSGHLFVAAELGDHHLYQITQLAENDDEPEFTTRGLVMNGRVVPSSVAHGGVELSAFVYTPRPLLNLVLLDVMESTAPTMQCRVEDLLGEDAPQFYLLCGRGPNSTLRILRHGLEVSQLAATELTASPVAIWSVKRSIHDIHDTYFIVSWASATVVLSVGDQVAPVSDSGLLLTVGTIAVSRIGEDDLLQVYTDGIRHIRADSRVNEWRTPGRRQIVRAAINDRQVVIALAGGELVYFELDITGQLNEFAERFTSSAEVCALAIAPVPADRRRARFLAVAAEDNTVRIVSLELSDTLQSLGVQTVADRASSLCFADPSLDNSSADLVLGVGLQNGILLRTSVEPSSGNLTDTRTRYLGTRPVMLFPSKVHGAAGFLALSSRPWIFYVQQGTPTLTPLSYDALDCAATFSAANCPNGLVAIAGNTLRVLNLPRLGSVFNQTSMPLKYTPRRFIVDSEHRLLVIAESDHNTFAAGRKAVEQARVAAETNTTQAAIAESLPDAVFGAPAAGAARWGSCLRIVDAQLRETLELIELDEDEGVFSMTSCSFHGHEGQTFFIVGTTKALNLQTRAHQGGCLYTYRFNPQTRRLDFVHRTEVEDVPGAMYPFQGRLLVGVGSLLRVYDLGKRKLLRKCENRSIPNFVSSITTSGGRIVVTDVQESFHFLRYRPSDNMLAVFADDSNPRWVTSSTMVDYDTVAAGDKFGNVFVLRLPQDLQDDLEDDPTGGRLLGSSKNTLNGAAQKADTIINFHVGDTVTTMQKTALIPSGSECLVYTTTLGAIGVLIPFTTQSDIDFFKHLEMHMRQENPPICGRDHLAFRSHYFPSKNVIDGDLCEQFNSLDPHKKRLIAGDLADRTPSEVSKKLEDLRTRSAF